MSSLLFSIPQAPCGVFLTSSIAMTLSFSMSGFQCLAHELKDTRAHSCEGHMQFCHRVKNYSTDHQEAVTRLPCANKGREEEEEEEDDGKNTDVSHAGFKSA